MKLSDFITCLRKTSEDDKIENRIAKIKEGYPVTRTPFVPDILKHAVDQKTFKSEKTGCRLFGITLAPEGSELVSEKSLEYIRRQLARRFNGILGISKQFEHSLARNTIAVSFAEYNFQVGNSCQEFVLYDGYKLPDDAYFTYRKLSENVQATYYNVNGVEFLAGICWYPVPHGKSKFQWIDTSLIYTAQMSSEPFPLEDREKSYNKTRHKVYGRYCTKAGKRVVVDCSELDGSTRHKEFNYVSMSSEYKFCAECFKDAITYKWVDPKHDSILDPAPSSVLEQPIKTLEELVIPRILELANSDVGESLKLGETISVFNRNTGKLLDFSECPKITELSAWLDANLDYDVHSENALIAHLSLGSGYKDRIGGDSSFTSELKNGGQGPSNPTTFSEAANSLEASGASDSSMNLSAATSTESLLKDYEKLEDTTKHDNELDVEVIN